MNRKYEFGRRPKQDDYDDFSEDASDELMDDVYDDESEEDEEVDFDRPTFRRDGIWNDYAEDLDYDQ